jgi:hypothetical protein
MFGGGSLLSFTRLGLRDTLKHVRAAFPDNIDVLRDVVYVEIWNYAMVRFSEQGTFGEIFAEVTDEMPLKSEDDATRLSKIIHRAQLEWKLILPGQKVVSV